MLTGVVFAERPSVGKACELSVGIATPGGKLDTYIVCALLSPHVPKRIGGCCGVVTCRVDKYVCM